MLAICTGWKAAVDGDENQYAGRYKTQLTKALIENHVTDDVSLERGLKELRRKQSPWLPSPGAFANWCKGITHASHIPFPALPSRQKEKTVGRQTLKAIRSRRTALGLTHE